jgi:polysaccharide deacetylase 2 family uncharacterized protein YibQ
MGTKKRRKEGLSSWGLLILGFAIGVAFLLALVKFGGIDLIRPVTGENSVAIHVPENPLLPVVPEPVPPPLRKALPDTSPRVAIVIDDMGVDINKLRELIEIDRSITVAIMPYQRYSMETASEAYNNGVDVLLHLPMEPWDLKDNDPGKGALLIGMTAEQVRAQVEQDLLTVPYTIGINNHMGSRFTEDEPLMRDVLEVVKQKDLFFLDSRTTPKSVALKLAKEMGVRNADRNVFLDNNRDVKYIKGQLAELVSIARKRGKAIAIGHPYPETIQALKESVPELEGKGVRVVRLSELVE